MSISLSLSLDSMPCRLVYFPSVSDVLLPVAQVICSEPGRLKIRKQNGLGAQSVQG